MAPTGEGKSKNGPVKSALLSFGPVTDKYEGTVLGLGIGCGIENGSVKPALLSFGPVAGKYEGSVLGLGIGCFRELSAGFNGVCTFIAHNRAVSYVSRSNDKSLKEALGMFHSGARRVWGYAAISPGSTSSYWTGAASLLACSRPPPATRMQVATPVLTS